LNQQNFVVSEDQGGTRLDRWVADELSIGRREAQEWIEQGQVYVNGRRAKKSTLLVVGDTVSVSAPSGERFAVEPDAPHEVVSQCPEALVVHKPAGQPCIPLKRGESGTLAQAVAGHFPEVLDVGRRAGEFGLVHRLDNDTSGLVLVAREAAILDHLVLALSQGRIEKAYLGLISTPEGALPKFVDVPLGPDPKRADRVRPATLGTRGTREARTEFELLETRGDITLIEARAPHAYRHQVRAHLAHLGCPLIGDHIYGGTPRWPFEHGHALHAHHMAWAGDERVPGFRLRLPIPDAFRTLLGATSERT
jgi:23S rRNA pseudouridine1911/1915/1917 synthase